MERRTSSRKRDREFTVPENVKEGLNEFVEVNASEVAAALELPADTTKEVLVDKLVGVMGQQSLSSGSLLGRFFSTDALGKYCEKKGKSAKGTVATLAGRIASLWDKMPTTPEQAPKKGRGSNSAEKGKPEPKGEAEAPKGKRTSAGAKKETPTKEDKPEETATAKPKRGARSPAKADEAPAANGEDEAEPTPSKGKSPAKSPAKPPAKVTPSKGRGRGAKKADDEATAEEEPATTTSSDGAKPAEPEEQAAPERSVCSQRPPHLCRVVFVCLCLCVCVCE